ncbi:MAG: class II aldolase/adducin family protein [bacterium]|nr:class II aldolase/adducin family protein [bacterium]
MTNQLESARQSLVETGQKLYAKGFLAGSDGNFSVRLPHNQYLITPSGLAKGDLARADLVLLDSHFDIVEGTLRPSSESQMHRFVYENRPDITACVHSHAPHCTAFAAAGRELPDNVLPEAILFVGRICLTEYAPPGTPAVANSLEPFIAENNAFLLRNHGLLTIGRSLEEAVWKHETVEHLARVCFMAEQIGAAQPIPERDYQRLTRMRESRQAAQTKQEMK